MQNRVTKGYGSEQQATGDKKSRVSGQKVKHLTNERKQERRNKQKKEENFPELENARFQFERTQ